MASGFSKGPPLGLLPDVPSLMETLSYSYCYVGIMTGECVHPRPASAWTLLSVLCSCPTPTPHSSLCCSEYEPLSPSPCLPLPLAPGPLQSRHRLFCASVILCNLLGAHGRLRRKIDVTLMCLPPRPQGFTVYDPNVFFITVDLVEGFDFCNNCIREVAQSCPTLCEPMDCRLPGSSVHGIFQAIVLEWIAISFSRGSSQPRDRTQVSRVVD